MKQLYLSCLFALLSIAISNAQELKDSFEVYFEFNKAVLKPNSKATIDSFLEVSKTRRLKVRVAGYTCDIGTDNYNMGLSEKRAISAFEYLKTTGEPEDKIELFFYGEKELKYGTGGKAENRRVFILFALEDDDRDTLLRSGCMEVFVEKGTFKPNKNKNIQFEYKTFPTANALKAANITMTDVNGKRYYTNGVAYFDAKFNGAALEPGKSVKIKLPAVGTSEDGFMLYTGVDQGGKIVWKPTGRSCGSIEKNGDCNTYNFDFQQTGYCGCLKPRACEEDCSEDPFGGLKSPDLKAADVRYSAAKTIAKIPTGMYKSDISGLKVDVVDDTNFEEDLDLCEQFTFGVVTEDWYPAYRSMKASQNIIMKTTDNSGNAQNGDANKTLRVMIPRSKVSGTQNPILLPGSRVTKGYIKWETSKYEQTKCLGPINCEYVVFDVPATGNYKLGEWNEVKAEAVAETYILKTRVIKSSTVLVGDKASNYVYKAKNRSVKGKTRTKEYTLRDADEMKSLVVLVKNETAKGKKTYAEVTLGELKYKAKKKMYVMRKKSLKKVKDFSEMQVSKCK
jgi:hypothetical protein